MKRYTKEEKELLLKILTRNARGFTTYVSDTEEYNNYRSLVNKVKEDNPVPSIEDIAELLNDAMAGHADAGASDKETEERYKKFKPWFDFKYVKEEEEYHFDTFTAVLKENGVETDNEQPKLTAKCCKCNKEHTIGDTIRYTKNYQVYCENDCSDDVETSGKTTLEKCWWGEE